MAAIIAITTIFVVSGTISFFSNLTLIQSLREQYPDYYKLAGSPTIAVLIFAPEINFKWGIFLLTRRFDRLSATPPMLLGTFRVAFWSGWLHVATLVLLVLSIVGLAFA